MWLEVILFGIVGLLLYKFLKPSKNFWEEYGVPQSSGAGFTNSLKVFLGKRTQADNDEFIYRKLGSSGKFCGMMEMQQPVLLVKDVGIIKNVLIKNFENFVDRRKLVGSQKQKIIDKMVVNLTGEEWKGVRTSLSPTFTSGKIRRMIHHFNNVAFDWIGHFKERLQNSSEETLPVNIQTETRNFTVDAIAAAVFGINAGTIRNPESIFAKMFRRLSEFNVIAIIKFVIAVYFPRLVKLFGINIMDAEALSFFEDILSQGLRARMEGKEKQNDFIQLLVEARKGELKSDASDELSSFEKEAQLVNDNARKNYLNDDITTTAQALQFFFAGFSTTSNFIGFALYMLALEPEVQRKLRDEINSRLFSKGDEKDIDYDELNSLPYLEMVVCEVLRKFPALGRLERVCVKEYFDESENLRVPKGAMVGIPVQSIHNDPQHYENPDKFYPEHFSPENKAKRSPYAYLPFGSGPRNCLGMRFALIEGKAAIAHLVHHFEIVPTKKTPVPYTVKPVGVAAHIPDGLELGLRLINE